MKYINDFEEFYIKLDFVFSMDFIFDMITKW